MFLIPSFGALVGLGQRQRGHRRDQVFLFLLFVVFAMVIGLRETGGDFDNYKRTVDAIAQESFWTSIRQGDPAFTIVAIISNACGFQIYGVNFVCGVLFLYGLLRFVGTLPDPWLAIAAAVPYMVIVIAMGYIRQGVAIGFILLALLDLDRRSYGWLAFHLLMALLFHVAAVSVMPIFALSAFRRQPLMLGLMAVAGAAAYVFLLQDRWTSLYANYVTAQYDSSGALVRLMMNAVPATVFLAFRKRFPISDVARVFWMLVSVLALAMLPTLAVSNSSTWIDRIGLFLSPIQLVVFGYLSSIFAVHVREQRVATLLALAFYGSVLFVWLNYAVNASSWLPYRWVIPVDIA
jgi:hypothetical protein